MDDDIVSFVVDKLKSIKDEQIKKKKHSVRGVNNKLLNSVSDKMETIKKVLHNAESQRSSEINIKRWLSKLEETCLGMEDILDEWNYIILESNAYARSKQKVRFPFLSFSCISFDSRRTGVPHDIAKRIRIVKSQLDQFNDLPQPTIPLPLSLLESGKPQTTSFVQLDKVHGRDLDKDNVVSKIKIILNKTRLGLVSIVGVVGLGKTTLAQLVYNDVKDYFNLSLWICVSGPFNEFEIAKEIIGNCNIDTQQLDTILIQVKESIKDKKFLLVLDDVRATHNFNWESLKQTLMDGVAGSTVMVTTRNENVAKMMGTIDNDIYRLGQLSDEDCYKLLYHTATISGSKEMTSGDFKIIGREIASKCKGLPLAAKHLGTELRSKKRLDEWNNMLNNGIGTVEETFIFPDLLLSYNELTSQHKRCFTYCAAFPKDYLIPVPNLIDFWKVLGYLGSSSAEDLEHKGRECFNTLVMHSLLIQEFKEDHDYCRIHDIVHDFAQYVKNNGTMKEGYIQNTTACKSCCSLLNNVKEYRSLFWNAPEAPQHLCDNCLRSLKVLKIECYSNWQTIPQRMKNMIHLRWLDLSDNKLSSEDLRTVSQLYNLRVVKFSQCGLLELPTEIGNLTHLRVLDLSENYVLMNLPESICNLLELQILDVTFCFCLQKLPEGIHSLTNLKYLYNESTYYLCKFPTGLAQLSGLCEMAEFRGGIGWNKLGLLKNLNKLGGIFQIYMKLEGLVQEDQEAESRKRKRIEELEGLVKEDQEAESRKRKKELEDLVDEAQEAESRKKHKEELECLVDEAQEAELRKRKHNEEVEGLVDEAREANLRGKKNIEHLWIIFHDEIDDEESTMRMDVINALEPHPNLQKLTIWNYKGSKLAAGWLQTLNRLTRIELSDMDYVKSLPPLWELSCLEEIEILNMKRFEVVGREFIGITSATAIDIGFPKLKKLVFNNCPELNEWEDITPATGEEKEEGEGVSMSLMPSLTELHVTECPRLKELPLDLLRHPSSLLETLVIGGSNQLIESYRNKDTSPFIGIRILPLANSYLN